MKRFFAAALILLAPVMVQAQDGERVQTSGSITMGVQQVEINNNADKFNEYRDIRDGFYLYDLTLEAIDTPSGHFIDFQGQNISRDDQELRFGLGSFGTWRLDLEQNKIPHNISNRALTPYIYQGNGQFTVPTPILPGNIFGYPNNAADRNIVLATDEATADWLETHLRHTDLGTQRNRTSASLAVRPLDGLKFRLTYADDRKDGSKITYGPIGNRPPNILDIQFTEPIDYTTREVKFEAEYNRANYQTLFSYFFSNFANDNDTLQWQNIWGTPANDLSYIVGTGTGGTHRLATFGQRALAPDNNYHNVSLSAGIDLPMASRLGATAAYGKMKQDKVLLPYSSSDFGGTLGFNDTATLPRLNADAEIDTKLFNLDYTIKPIDRLNLRAFYRYYDLDNKTTESNWHYVTSDAMPAGHATGGTTYKNKRTNLAYAYNTQNYGLDATYRLAFLRTTLGLGYEREEIDRDYREADTEENILKASISMRPADWLAIRARYLYGDREADNYNNNVTALSYWYVPADVGTDNDNPKFTFANHPDTRKFDVSDRERNQFDISATVMPLQGLDLTASYVYRKDDFDMGDVSSQPLLGSGLADAERVTPGDQLGLLEMKVERYALDGAYAPTERLTLTAFFSRDELEQRQRGLEFNENNKQNPSAVDTAELGNWDRPTAQWIAKTDDRTNTFGIGTGYQIIPGKLNFVTDYTYAQGKVDIEYSGYGAVSSLTGLPVADTNQFGFRTPPTTKHNQYTINASLEYQLVRNLIFGLHYLFDRYKIDDWMQEADTPWFESVAGNEYLLRDTSQSHQWGNRLVNMGSYLGGGSYEAHVGYATMTYKF
jgi:MtrB/PioB family decaheme-associated outer membrane protein